MNQLTRIAFLCMLLSCFAQKPCAQIPLLPVRENHRWHFVNTWGNTPERFIGTEYDFMANYFLPWNIFCKKIESSPFRVVEQQGKAGLIDMYLNTVLECRFKRIRPLSHNYFAVEYDSLFTVIDRNYNNLMGGARYEEISAADSLNSGNARYFLVKEEGKWGIYENGGQLVVPPQYSDIRATVEPDLFMVRKRIGSDTLWGLINNRNDMVLPFEYHNILVCSSGLFAVSKTKNAGWTVIERNRKPKIDGTWKLVRILNEDIITLDAGEKSRPKLWSLRSNEFLPTPENAESFFPTADGYIRYSRSEEWYGISGLLDPQGKLLLNAVYKRILPGGIPGVFQTVSGSELVGIYNVNGLSFHPKYASISDFQDSLAIVTDESGWNMINLDTMEVIDFPLNNIWVKEGIVYGTTSKGTLARYYLKSKGKLPNYDLHTGYRSTKVVNTYYDVTLPPKTKITRKEDDEERSFLGFMDTPFILSDTSPFLTVRKVSLPFGDYYAYYLKERPAPNDFGPLKKAFCRMKLVASDRTVIKIPDLIGIRWSDFHKGYPYAAFLDAKGQMGLIDRNWSEVKDLDGTPLRFSYICPFEKAGPKGAKLLARVCRGGKLKTGNHDKFNCGNNKYLLGFFDLHEPTREFYEITDKTKKSFFVSETGNNKPQWGIFDISETAFLVLPQYDFIEPFHPADSLSIIYKGEERGAINYQNFQVFELSKQKLERVKGLFKTAVATPKDVLYDLHGRQISGETYIQYRDYSNGRCAVLNKARLWGYIDSSNQEVIKCQYKAVETFSEGLAAVKGDANDWYFINVQGDTVFHYGPKLFTLASERADKKFKEKFDPEKDKKLRFKNGRCVYYVPEKGLWGYLGMNGDTIVLPKYEGISEFSNGLALVRGGLSEGKVQASIIDTSGREFKRILPYFYIYPFNEYNSAVACRKKGGPYGLINREGFEITYKMKYDTILPFFEGFAVVWIGKGEEKRWGVLRADGQEVISPTYIGIEPVISEGLILVNDGPNKWFFLDTLGKRPFGDEKTYYSKASYFKGGLAEVNKNEMIDRTGKKLNFSGKTLCFHAENIFVMQDKDKKEQYCADAQGNNLFDKEFSEVKKIVGKDLVIVQESGRTGAINRRGVFAIPPKFSKLEARGDGGSIRCITGNLYGLKNNQGKEVIPSIYDKVEIFLPYNDNELKIIRAELGEKVAYFVYNKKGLQWQQALQN